jgi:hypothetical protein
MPVVQQAQGADLCIALDFRRKLAHLQASFYLPAAA